MDDSLPYCLRDTILNSINEGVFTVDLDKRICSFNAAAERITEVNGADALGRRCDKVFRANLCRKDCAMDRTLATGRPVVHVMGYIINAHRKRIPVRISTALLKDASGGIMGGVETFQDLRQVEILCRELQAQRAFEKIVGESPPMKALFDILPQIAVSDSTVLIQGASGAGKELVARAIHNMSGRRHSRFVAVNTAAIPDSLLDSELFGYKAGAFTDAKRDKLGRFALAAGGSVFLDEIGDMSPALQARLLRVLQERTVEPLGALEPVKVDVRVIAATNKDLAELVKKGVFREDLYYRINVVHLDIPPLRERLEDIPLLVDHFVQMFNERQNRSLTGVSRQVMNRLMEYDYPGNVRELGNIIEQAFVLCRTDVIEMNHLPPELWNSKRRILDGLTGHDTLKDMEKVMITAALERHNSNRRRAAESLGINPSTLYRKIIALNIRVRDD